MNGLYNFMQNLSHWGREEWGCTIHFQAVNLPPTCIIRQEVMFSQASVCLSTWGGGVTTSLSHNTFTGPMSFLGIPQSQVGVPQDWVPPRQDGVPPARLGWGIPWPGHDGVPPDTLHLGQVIPRAVGLLRFPAGGLSCLMSFQWLSDGHSWSQFK